MHADTQARPAGRNATIERAAHARRLVDYLRSPEKESAEKVYMVAYMLEQKLSQTAGERLFHIGARGFVSTTIEGQRAEMIAIAQMAKRSPNPVDHWILSWPEGELPEPDQIDEVVAMFVEHLGVDEQPCIYAVHGDTHNRHLHIALNRYDPLERRMVEINDGFNLEAAHQAVAIIVDHFDWRPEPDARYEVVGDRVLLTSSAQARITEGREPIGQKAAAYENRTGYRSAQRIAQDEAVPIIAGARSWGELHARLAKAGMTYTPKGTNGVLIEIGDDKVKASSVNRAITRARLEKRLGAFEPPEATLSPSPRAPELDRFPDAFRADEHRAECDHWRRRNKPGKTPALKSADEPARSDTIAEARAAARAREDRASAKPGRPGQPPPNLESWYYWRNEGLFAERWRNRGRLTPFPALVGTPRADVEPASSIDSYYGYRCAEGMRYARGPRAPTEFIDRGARVEVVLSSDETLMAALKLAAHKFGGKTTFQGSPEMRLRVFALAEASGLADLLTGSASEAECSTVTLDQPLVEIAPPRQSQQRREVVPVDGGQSDNLENAGSSSVLVADPVTPIPPQPDGIEHNRIATSAKSSDLPGNEAVPAMPANDAKLRANEEEHGRQRSNARRSGRTTLHKLARPRPRGLVPIGEVAGLRSLPTIGVDDRRRKPASVVQRLLRDNVRGRAEREEVRGSGSIDASADEDAPATQPAPIAPISQPLPVNTALSSQPEDLPVVQPKLTRSLAKGPNDVNSLPNIRPPDRGISRD
ncbi:relaxase/mobilization nuclease domain-containing protein [Sphingomonas bacterium]|uniref:relaxase/mobilization nuclease domain-containing protein n=1 Tax=Sphingomonas bacterium TaxID=1895847 RepID=UPI001575FF53|nr:relaxase/mobilization nuclease domain-containing protein [Sphingomonas bacterium]